MRIPDPFAARAYPIGPSSHANDRVCRKSCAADRDDTNASRRRHDVWHQLGMSRPHRPAAK
jgi:hypothetical protein